MEILSFSPVDLGFCWTFSKAWFMQWTMQTGNGSFHCTKFLLVLK